MKERGDASRNTAWTMPAPWTRSTWDFFRGPEHGRMDSVLGREVFGTRFPVTMVVGRCSVLPLAQPPRSRITPSSAAPPRP
eukprot:CAMPEP_0114135394 /NCGR_PEP_ID=MMETSP0043_2-20121206/14674_1 /TAXON_ID=464988 /ORGANISM="Hemiselmis andersenii, Strain CCMP644" /LENGTH=80 /DNA_ID=CAMNT_0001229111 /DNA_START=576 /DNA_END=815 /DNA_ORIENTATION=-